MKKLLILLSFLLALSGSFVHADTEIVDGVVTQGGTEIIDGVPQESDYPIYGDVEVINGVRTTGDVETVNGVPQNFFYDFRFDADSSNPLVALGKQGSVGTFTYTGAASRSYIDADGVMQFEADDTKPIYETVGGRKALRLEHLAANLCLDSRNIDGGSAHWAASNATGAQDAVGVFGDANKASTLTDASAAAAGYVHQTVSINPNSGPWALTVYLAINATPNAYPAAGMLFSGTANKTAYYCLNPTDGTSTGYVSSNAGSVSIIEHGEVVTGFWKYTIIATDNGANDTLSIRLYPAWAETESSAIVVAAQGSNVFDAIDLKYSGIYSSYVDMAGVVLGSDIVVDGGFAGDTLGAELVTDSQDRDFGTDADTGNWVKGGTDTGTFAYSTAAIGGADDKQVLLTGVGDGILFAKITQAELSNFTANTWYEFTANAYVTPSQSVSLKVNDFDADRQADYVLSDATWTPMALRFYIDTDVTGEFQVRFTVAPTAGALLYFDDISIKELTLNDWNEGDYVGHTGSADTITVTGNQAAEVTLEQGYMDWSKPVWEDLVDSQGTRAAVTDGNTITITSLDRDEDVNKLRQLAAPIVTTSDFTHYVDVKYTALTGSGFIAPWALTSENDEIGNIVAGGAGHHALYLGMGAKLRIYEVDDGVNDNTGGQSATLTINTSYYLTIRCDASEGAYGTIYCDIYSDAARTALVETIYKTLTMDHSHDYIGAVSYNAGVGSHAWSGTIENLSIYKKPTPGKTYKIGTTATRTGGSYIVEYGSTEHTTDGDVAHAAAGTFYDYIVATDNDFLKIKFDSAFIGTLDDITIEEMGDARLSEAGALTFTLPTGIFDDTGTAIVWWMPGFDEDEVSGNSGIFACRTGAILSVFYHDYAANGIASYDSSNAASKALAFTKDTWYKLAVVFPSDTDKFKIGVDTGSGISFGAEAAFDGAYAGTGAKLLFGYGLKAPMYFSGVSIYDRVLSTPQVNAIGGSP